MAHTQKAAAIIEMYMKAHSLIDFLKTCGNEDLPRARRIVKEELPAAVMAFRADLGIYPMPNDDGFCNLAALNDRTMVPSFLQDRWNGPYTKLNIRSCDLNRGNILADEENRDIRYGVMIVPARHFRDVTLIKNGSAEGRLEERYFSVVALLPKYIAECLKTEAGGPVAVYEWDNRLSMLFYAFDRMRPPVYR
jgi:hypothetical protein